MVLFCFFDVVAPLRAVGEVGGAVRWCWWSGLRIRVKRCLSFEATICWISWNVTLREESLRQASCE